MSTQAISIGFTNSFSLQKTDFTQRQVPSEDFYDAKSYRNKRETHSSDISVLNQRVASATATRYVDPNMETQKQQVVEMLDSYSYEDIDSDKRFNSDQKIIFKEIAPRMIYPLIDDAIEEVQRATNYREILEVLGRLERRLLSKFNTSVMQKILLPPTVWNLKNRIAGALDLFSSVNGDGSQLLPKPRSYYIANLKYMSEALDTYKNAPRGDLSEEQMQKLRLVCDECKEVFSQIAVEIRENPSHSSSEVRHTFAEGTRKIKVIMEKIASLMKLPEQQKKGLQELVWELPTTIINKLLSSGLPS